MAAQGEPEVPAAKRALDELCRAYWYPVYSYARRHSLSAEDAEDATQGFFAKLLAHGSFNDLAPDKGRMRAYLLTAMKRFLASQWRKENALKRGGDTQIIAIDLEQAEGRFAREPVATEDSPDRAFEKAWAHSLLGSVYSALERHYRDSGQERQFIALRPFLAWGESDQPLAEIATQLGMNEGSVRTAIHRMRQRYRNLLESEIRDTVASQEEAAEELDYLKKILAGGRGG